MSETQPIMSSAESLKLQPKQGQTQSCALLLPGDASTHGENSIQNSRILPMVSKPIGGGKTILKKQIYGFCSSSPLGTLCWVPDKLILETYGLVRLSTETLQRRWYWWSFQKTGKALARGSAVTHFWGQTYMGFRSFLMLPQTTVHIQSSSLCHTEVSPPLPTPPTCWKQKWKGYAFILFLRLPGPVFTFLLFPQCRGREGEREKKRKQKKVLHGEFNSAELHCSYVRFEALSHAQPVASSTISAQPQHCVSFDKSPCVISAVPVIRLQYRMISSCGFFIPVYN